MFKNNKPHREKMKKFKELANNQSISSSKREIIFKRFNADGGNCNNRQQDSEKQVLDDSA